MLFHKALNIAQDKSSSRLYLELGVQILVFVEYFVLPGDQLKINREGGG